jgi:hypothetical protein
MLASSITARNIIRSALTSKSIYIDKHSYTEKTSIKDVNRRSVVFKTSPIINKAELINYINLEFIKYGFSNTITITNQKFPSGYTSPYTYIRVITYIR